MLTASQHDEHAASPAAIVWLATETGFQPQSCLPSAQPVPPRPAAAGWAADCFLWRKWNRFSLRLLAAAGPWSQATWAVHQSHAAQAEIRESAWGSCARLTWQQRTI